MCSTEAEFLPAFVAAKHLHAVLPEHGFPQYGPTVLCEDDVSTINMINNCVPTE